MSPRPLPFAIALILAAAMVSCTPGTPTPPADGSDTAAADAVLRAAGGRVITLDGQPLEYGKRGQPQDTDFANPGFIAAGAWNPLAG